jgi:tetratricopeptide (TPR) repeat protein
MGQVREMQGQAERALENYRSALEVLSGLPQQHEVLAHLRLSFLRLYRLHDIETAQQEALLARAKADAFLGDMAALRGDYRTALVHLSAAEEVVERHGDLVTRSRVYSYLGALHGRLGDHAAALGYIERAIHCDEQRGDEVGPLYDRLNRAMVYRLAGRAEESRREALDALETARRFRNSYLIAGLAAGVAEASYDLGDYPAAEHFALAALREEEEFFRAPACVILAWLRHRAGRNDEAFRLLAEALDSAQRIEDRYTEAYVLRSSGEIHRRAGLADDARTLLERALHIYSGLGLAHEAGGVIELLEAAKLPD